MSPLAQLQGRFLSHLQAPVHDDVSGVASGRLAAATGLRIYANAYRSRLEESLANDHRALGLYLGDDLWQSLCEGYIAAHPSRVRSLRDFGAWLPGYLARTPPFAADPRIAELAKFERALLHSFDAADAPRITFDALRGRDAEEWPTVRLTLHPSHAVTAVATNAVDTWSALTAGTPPPGPGPSVAPAWATWRDEDRVSRFRSVGPAEYAALRRVLDGGSLADVCEALASEMPPDEVAAEALRLLTHWFAEGWVTAARP